MAARARFTPGGGPRAVRSGFTVAFDGVGSLWDNPGVLRLLTRAIPAFIVAAWLAPSFATIAVGFHLWADHHGELHSHADELETELTEADAHQHRLVIDADEDAVRLSRGQAASGSADAPASPLPSTVAPKPGGVSSAFLEGSSRYGPAPPRYLSHCAFLL